MLIVSIAAMALALLLIGGTFFYLKNKVGSSIAREIEAKSEQVKVIIAETGDLLKSADKYASKAQLDNVVKQIEDARTSLAREKETLTQLESKLDTVQKSVEAKEVQHQEMKTAREEEEARLAELLANYETISNESIALEQRLAESLKNLDAMMDGVQMTDEQRLVLEELSGALTNTGARLRDLLTEYNMVKERLDTLSGQHRDLEEEYTRLVEQQLGE